MRPFLLSYMTVHGTPRTQRDARDAARMLILSALLMIQCEIVKENTLR